VNSWNSLPPEIVDTPFMQVQHHWGRQEISSMGFAHPRTDLSVESKVRIALAGKNQITAFSK